MTRDEPEAEATAPDGEDEWQLYATFVTVPLGSSA